jgi:hypothetical protein
MGSWQQAGPLAAQGKVKVKVRERAREMEMEKVRGMEEVGNADVVEERVVPRTSQSSGSCRGE